MPIRGRYESHARSHRKPDYDVAFPFFHGSTTLLLIRFSQVGRVDCRMLRSTGESHAPRLAYAPVARPDRRIDRFRIAAVNPEPICKIGRAGFTVPLRIVPVAGRTIIGEDLFPAVTSPA